MGAEDASVDVGLVDHDDREVREQLRPGPVVGQDADVEHVGVGEHDVGFAADLGARLLGRIAVIDRGPDTLRQPEAGQRPRLILGQRLGRIEVERSRSRLAAEHLDRGQVEAHRLARGGAGRDDHRSLPGCLQRLRLVAVELLDAKSAQRGQQLGVKLGRERAQARLRASVVSLADQSPVRSACGEDLAPAVLGRGGRRGWLLRCHGLR